MSNLSLFSTQFCCGMSELGNFDYIDPEGTSMTHYHKVDGTWKTQDGKSKTGTTKEEIQNKIKYANGIIATTGKGQEYVEPLLLECGFKHIYSFTNTGHYQTEIKVWAYSKKPIEMK